MSQGNNCHPVDPYSSQVLDLTRVSLQYSILYPISCATPLHHGQHMVEGVRSLELLLQQCYSQLSMMLSQAPIRLSLSLIKIYNIFLENKPL